jgi:hypothetical protein
MQLLLLLLLLLHVLLGSQCNSACSLASCCCCQCWAGCVIDQVCSTLLLLVIPFGSAGRPS